LFNGELLRSATAQTVQSEQRPQRKPRFGAASAGGKEIILRQWTLISKI
jgi:hypothetical protein